MLLQGQWTDNAALCTTMAAPKSVFWHDNHGEEICTVPKCSSWFYQQSEFVFTSQILKWLWTYSLKCCINYAYFRGIQFQNTHIYIYIWSAIAQSAKWMGKVSFLAIITFASNQLLAFYTASFSWVGILLEEMDAPIAKSGRPITYDGSV